MSLSDIALLILIVLAISIMMTVARTHNYAQQANDKVDKILKLLNEKKD